MQRPVVSSEFLLSRYSLSWRLMDYALQHEGIRGWLSWNAAVQMAVQRVSTHKYSPEELALASLDRRQQDRKHELVRGLAGKERPAARECLHATWLHVVLAWLWESRGELSGAEQWLEVIYTDFDEPQGMASMIRRAPSRVVTFGGSWEERREAAWRQFLDQRPAEARATGSSASGGPSANAQSKSIGKPKRLISR
jgi:hypothetical protein